jgi:hypothetical protein
LAEKLKEYFVNHALLDVDPDTGGSTGYIPVAQQDLTDQSPFFDVRDTEEGGKRYIKWDYNSTTQVHVWYTETNSSDGIITSFEGDYDYQLDEGKIVVDTGGGTTKTYALRETEGDRWAMDELQHDGAEHLDWFFAEPVGFRYPE